MGLLDLFKKPAAVESLPVPQGFQARLWADMPALAKSAIAGPNPVAVPPVGRLAG